jgi:hypothetical protein
MPTPPTPFAIVIGRKTKGFYLSRKLILNFRGKETPTTLLKVANFFTEIKPQICKNECQTEFPNISSSELVLNLSIPELHG